jgi:hypothetical protein
VGTRVGREAVSRFVDFRIFNLTRLSRAKRANSYLLVEQIPTWARQCGTIIGRLERLDDPKVKA